MYIKHFGLSEFPFGLTPDTQFYCDLPTHRQALNVLLIALHNGEGFIKITGEVGTGKTLLCRKILKQLQTPFISAYIANPNLSAKALYQSIASEFEIAPDKTKNTPPLQQINSFLLQAAANKQQPVLLIDEAQSMPVETLEALRLLTNLETEKQKLIQIVLFGQTELDRLLEKKQIRQLRQRISFNYCLQPLNKHELKTYLQHRLNSAQCSDPLMFSRSAINSLHFYSRGIPRLINILAHKALLSAYGKGLYKIDRKQVQLAALDTDDSRNHLSPFSCRKTFLIALFFSLCSLILVRI